MINFRVASHYFPDFSHYKSPLSGSESAFSATQSAFSGLWSLHSGIVTLLGKMVTVEGKFVTLSTSTQSIQESGPLWRLGLKSTTNQFKMFENWPKVRRFGEGVSN